MKYGSTPYHYCLKDDLIAMELNHDALCNMMEENFEIFKTVSNDRKSGKSTTKEDYVKIPIFDVDYNNNSNRKEFVCLKLASWIFTYSKRQNLADLKVIAKSLNIECDLIVDSIKEYGKDYYLSYEEGKRGYRRVYHVIFDRSSYLELNRIDNVLVNDIKKIDESKILKFKIK